MNNGDMPVTPISDSYGRIRPFTDDDGFSSMATGLTKREAFAMAAMQGLLANGIPDSAVYGVPCNEYELLAAASVLQADALLKELSK